MNTNKKVLTMTAGATIAVLALAVGSFVIASSSVSNLIQPAYAAKEPSGQTFYCFTFQGLYGDTGLGCGNSVDKAEAREQCELTREIYAQDPNTAYISKCEVVKPK